MRYGSSSKWSHRQDTGSGQCTTDYFLDWDTPITECQVFVPGSVTSPAPTPGGGPLIDVAKIPFGSPGASVDQVSTTGEQPVASDIGAFRTVCDYSHMAFDDPIVKPGQPGASHLHVFYGNTATTANSTASSIASGGNSTCRGGTANRTAYWIPAMIDTRDGTPITAHNAGFYYKSGYYGIAPSSVKALPQGLRMVAGDSKNATANNAYGYFECSNGYGGRSAGVLNCPSGTSLTMHLDFPQCWDGVNLDSPDHKSHMSYPVAGKCPSTHPVATPVITFVIDWQIKETNAPLRWRFSSDNYSTSSPGGYSMHGDWFNGWKAPVMDAWITKCVNPTKDCHSHLLGDGRAIY